MTFFLFVIRLLATLSCGLMAGVYFAFSTSVMPGLARLSPSEGMTAMQAVSRAILNPLFLSIFTSSAVLCALVFLTSFGHWDNPATWFFLSGGVIGILGSFVVTMLLNVPLNNALDAAVPTSSEGAAAWSHYLTTWTPLNHLRTVSSLLAAALLTIGLYLHAK
jgi:uncharacterized membrane protein